MTNQTNLPEILILTGAPRGEHHATCLMSYFGLGLPEKDKWIQFDLQNSDDYIAHSLFSSILGIPQPTFETHSPELILPNNLSIPPDTFLTRQAFGVSALLIYRAGFGRP